MRTKNARHKVPDGPIRPGEPFADSIGFTAEKFSGYMWKAGDEIWIASIVSLQPGQGNLSDLLAKIGMKGYKVIVTTPFPKMANILRHLGFEYSLRTFESSPDFFTEIGGSGLVWEHHKMGVKVAGLPIDEKVEVWAKTFDSS